jgi:G3E family GTPase
MGGAAGLYLFTGFLGSGKTTVLNAVLRSLGGKRVGVIVNEWGKIGVDGSLLSDPSGLGVVELAGGQIFCSCVSGSFIAAAARLASLGLDYLLVETSGLAKPSVLGDIVAEVEKRGAGSIEYRGMICVVDALRFPILRSAAAVLDEQVAYSDVFLVTKTDLAGPRSLDAAREALASVLGPERAAAASVAEVVSGALDPDVLVEILSRPRVPAVRASDPRWRGWGPAGRPGTTSVVPREAPSSEGLGAFLRELDGAAYRAKGFLRLADRPGRCYVDWTESLASVGPGPAGAAEEAEEGLAIIWKGAAPSADSVAATWARTAGVPARVC